MKNIVLFLSVFLSAHFFTNAQTLPAPIASPIQMGAYVPGLIGPRDYANPGFSGIIAIDYNVFFSSNGYYDRHGNKVNSLDLVPKLDPILIDIDLSGYINALAVAYVSPELDFLGDARYIAVVAPYYATSSYNVALSELIREDKEVTGGAGGIGDLSIAPLFLSWADENEKYDITAGYLFSAPTGRYKTGADNNIGLGYWNHILQLFGYYFPLPQKATAIFLGNSFEIHSNVKDVDVTPGSRYTLEYGVSQYLSKRFEVTVQGGHTWQVSEDSGDDVYWDTSFKDRNSIVGVGIGFWPVPKIFYTHLKWMTNYGMRQHFKVQTLQLELIVIPWTKK